MNRSQGDVRAKVRDAIVSGDYAPGQRLVEADLSEQFGASRTAVRSALAELVTEGLVERVQHRGARVRVVPLAEAIEICEVRMVVEGLCAAKAATKVDATEVDELRALGGNMEKAVSAGDILGYSQLNQLLHRRIREISGQSTASQVLDRLRTQSVRHQFRLAMQPGRPQVSLPEHLAIIDGICARDPDAAERAARIHLASVIAAMDDAADSTASAHGAPSTGVTLSPM